jgi:hypothetical protein
VVPQQPRGHLEVEVEVAYGAVAVVAAIAKNMQKEIR